MRAQAARVARITALMVGVLALGGAPSLAGRSGLARPLSLPHVVPGAPCPTSAGLPAESLGHGLPQTMQAAGLGPVYALAVVGTPAGHLRVSATYRDRKGWVGQKSPWLISPMYRGPILVRGARIDGNGEMRFAFGTGQHLRTLRVEANKGERRNGWRAIPSLTLVRRPGCYGYQIDGTTFSEVIVVRILLTA